MSASQPDSRRSSPPHCPPPDPTPPSTPRTLRALPGGVPPICCCDVRGRRVFGQPGAHGGGRDAAAVHARVPRGVPARLDTAIRQLSRMPPCHITCGDSGVAEPKLDDGANGTVTHHC